MWIGKEKYAANLDGNLLAENHMVKTNKLLT